MARAPFTPAQRRDWQARMQVRLPNEKDFRLAARMKLESNSPRDATDYDKTVAGYLGELRRGEPRALTWFLDNEARLTALARVAGCRPEDIRADLRAVEESEQGPLDRLWWSGFEDLGVLTLVEGFVLPPVFDDKGNRLSEADLRKLVLEKQEIRVDGPPGSGVSTLLRWLAGEAAEQDWRPTRWDGLLPTGRALVVLADPDDGLDAAAKAAGTSVADWLKSRDLRLLRRGPGGLRVGPVDLPWLRELRTRIAAKAGRRMKLSGIADRDLEALVGLGPEEAGLRLRDRLEPARGGAAGLVLEGARRRLVAQGESTEGLARMERWLPEFYLRLLRQPEADVVDVFDDAVTREVGRLIHELRVNTTERDLLLSALPLVKGTAAREALLRARVLDEQRGAARLRLTGLIAPMAAERIRDDAALLRRCLVRRDATALQAVFDVAGGPEAIVSGLNSLEAPGLKAALAEIPLRWRAELPWTATLLARWMVLTELALFGTTMREGVEKLVRSERDGLLGKSNLNMWLRRVLMDKALSALAGVRGPLPPMDLLEAVWSEVARELGLAEATPDTDELRWLRALHFSAAEDLRSPEVWAYTPDDLVAPPAWREAARKDPKIALQLLRRLDLERSSSSSTLWVEAVATLIELAPTEGTAAVAAYLEGVRLRFEQELGEWLPACSTWDGAVVDFGMNPLFGLESAWSALRNRLELLPTLLDALPRPAVLRATLLAEARAWRAVAALEQIVFVEGPFNVDNAGLRELLATLSDEERTAWLRTPSGRSCMLVGVLARAGVAPEALIALYGDLQAGVVPWLRMARRQEPDTGNELIDPQRRAWLALLMDTLPPERLDELGVAAATWVHVVGGGEESRSTWRALGSRRWRWTLHHDLQPEDPIWSLLLGLPYDDLRWKLYDEASKQVKLNPGAVPRDQGSATVPTTVLGIVGAVFGEGIAAHAQNPEMKRLLELDCPHLMQTLARSDSLGPVDAIRWALLTRAALLAGVSDDALWRLIELELDLEHADKAHLPMAAGVFAVLARYLARLDYHRIRSWMIGRVGTLGSLLDRAELVEHWEALPPEDLRRILASLEGDEVGDGLALALLRRSPEDIEPLLSSPRTRTATLQALSREPALRPQLATSLARLGGPPSAAALQAILKLSDPDPVELLADVAASWPVEIQKRLWRQVAGLGPGGTRRKKKGWLRTPSSSVRAQAWERLAALEAAAGSEAAGPTTA